MLKHNMQNRHSYEPPMAEVIAIEAQSVFCASGPSMMNSGTGTNESMTIQEIGI